MSTRKNFNTTKVTRMSEVFPHAVITNNLIFLSGMPGIDPATGQLVSRELEEQMRQSLRNIQTVLEEAGSSLSKVVKTTLYMVAGNDFTVISKVYQEFFPKEAPARSIPQVMPFPGGILISIECIAEK